ncbi:MAG: hypothetical protein ACH350_04505 [Parachlamydiaceae bacterium]
MNPIPPNFAIEILEEIPLQQGSDEREVDLRIQSLIHHLSNSVKTAANAPEKIESLNQVIKKGPLVDGLALVDASSCVIDRTTYQELMKLMRKEKRKSELQEALFALIKIEEKLDPDICATHLAIYGERVEFQKARQVFNDCVQLSIKSPTLYSSYIRVCGACGQIEEVESVLKEIENESKRFRSPSYVAGIEAYFQNQAVVKAQEIFERVIASTSLDLLIFSTYLKGCLHNQCLGEAELLLEKAKILNNRQVDVYNFYLKACQKNGEKEKAKKAFKEAQSFKMVNFDTYALYLDLSLAHDMQDEAKEVFAILFLKEMANRDIYLRYFEFCQKNDLMEEGLKELERGMSCRMIDHIPLYCFYLEMFKQKGNVKKIEKIFEYMVLNEISDPDTYSIYFDACGENAMAESTKKGWDHACARGIVNEKLRRSYFDACMRNDWFEEAQKTWANLDFSQFSPSIHHLYLKFCAKRGIEEELVKELEKARLNNAESIEFYHAILEAYGKNRQMEKAKDLFEELCSKELAIPLSYHIYLDICTQNYAFQEAEQVFEKLIDKREDDLTTHHLFIDALVRSGRIQLAKEMFLNSGKIEFRIIEKQGETPYLDLEDYSLGSAFIAILRFLEERPNEKKIGIICGMGCLKDRAYSLFREEMCLFLSRQLMGVSLSRVSFNNRVLFFTIIKATWSMTPNLKIRFGDGDDGDESVKKLIELAGWELV